MSVERVVVEGFGLHTGSPVRVVLWRRAGAVTLRAGGVERTIAALRVASAARATSVESPRVGTVEHLFAALAGLGVRDGIAIEVEGPELPLLDGGASAWCDAVDMLKLVSADAPAKPTLTIVRDGTVDVGDSRYEVARGARVTVRAKIEFDDARVAPEAEWLGDAADFRARIAPARTFAFLHELAALHARGLGSHVSPESVIVIAPEAIHSKGNPFTADEPARHKLLDLIGDLYLYGGPPRGVVRAIRPGHGATHAFVRAALERGLLARSDDARYEARDARPSAEKKRRAENRKTHHEEHQAKAHDVSRLEPHEPEQR